MLTITLHESIAELRLNGVTSSLLWRDHPGVINSTRDQKELDCGITHTVNGQTVKKGSNARKSQSRTISVIQESCYPWSQIAYNDLPADHGNISVCNRTHGVGKILTSTNTVIYEESLNPPIIKYVFSVGPALIFFKKRKIFHTQKAKLFRRNCPPVYRSKALGAADENKFFSILSIWPEKSRDCYQSNKAKTFLKMSSNSIICKPCGPGLKWTHSSPRSGAIIRARATPLEWENEKHTMVPIAIMQSLLPRRPSVYREKGRVLHENRT